MTQEQPAANSARGCRALGCFCLAVGFFFLLMMAGIGTGLFELGWALVFGWVGFLSRVLPKVSWDWGAMITGVVFAGLIGILAHSFLAWLARGIAVARGTRFRWQPKWTLCALLLCAFCLLVGMSIAGAAHQLGWMFASHESLFEDRYAMYRIVDVNRVEIAMRQALLHPNTLPQLRRELPTLMTSPELRRHLLPLESVRVLVSLSSSNTVDGAFILPRDKKFETRYGVRYVGGNDSGPMSPSELQRFIQANPTNLVSL